MTDHLQAIATVLSLINPAICGAIFARLEAGRPGRSQAVDATKAAIAILVILSLTALFGTALLRAFGISLPAFQVSGGGVLVWMGFSMLRGWDSDSPGADSESSGEPVLTPLILFAASPGTIAGVITLSATHSPSGLPVTSLVAVGVAVVVTWIAVMLSTRLAGARSDGGLLHDVISRFMGLVVVAMGVQFGLTGAKSFIGAG